MKMISRYAQTLRYLRLRQLLWRPYLRISGFQYGHIGALRSAWESRARAIAGSMVPRVPSPLGPVIHWVMAMGRDQRAAAEMAVRREFAFLNRSVHFQDHVNWRFGEAGRLWRFNLHYQAYLVALGVAYREACEPRFYAAFKDLVGDWVAANPMPRGDGWHPYVVSVRVVNWLLAMDLFSEPLARDWPFLERLLRSLVGQVLYVARHLEFDVGGNHLIANIKALCLAGARFGGAAPDRWLRRGLRLLRTEVARQVLPDGGHYERSPMYHAIVLEDLTTVAATLTSAGIPWPKGLHDGLARMADFLGSVLHPDGQIPLLNDSVLGVAAEPGSLIAFVRSVLGEAGPQPRPGASSVGFDATGYFVSKRGTDFLVADAGPTCPDELPGHAHADMLSYELSVGGRRLVVDSGVKEYEAGEWRDYARSTRAHNTITVGGLNQVDVWASFRVGRRVKPSNVSWQTTADGTAILAGCHPGYGRARPHTRVLVDLGGPGWVVIDEVGGTGSVPVESFIHLHPGVIVTVKDGGAVFEEGGRTLRLLVAGATGVELIAGARQPLNGWYMREFGLAEANPTLVLQAGTLPCLVAYAIVPECSSGDLRLAQSGDERLCRLELPAGTSEVHWRVSSPRPTLKRSGAQARREKVPE